MAQVGIVKTLEGGVFYAKDSSGNIRELSIGDSILQKSETLEHSFQKYLNSVYTFI